MGWATFEELNSHLWLVAFPPEQHMVMSSKVWQTAEGWIKEESSLPWNVLEVVYISEVNRLSEYMG